MAGITALLCLVSVPASAEETPEAVLVRELADLRRRGLGESRFGFHEAASEAVEAYEAASQPPLPYAERSERFARALRDQDLLTPCERRQFAEISAGREADAALTLAGERDSGVVLDVQRQVSREQDNILKIQHQVSGHPGLLVALLVGLFEPDRQTFSPLFSGLGHESFVFCGDDVVTSPEALAQLFAPILWYSYDEPLHLERIPVPQALPTAASPAAPPRRTVYYQITAGSLLHGRLGPYQGSAASLDLLNPDLRRNLKLRYFFYYQRDTGTNGHPHDVEGAELFLEVRPWSLGPSGERCVRVHPRMLRGLAHGLTWSANHLRFEGGRGCDAAFPLTMLVEEGKHATCPDRNGDGIYTPGYDVNFWVNEAWGIRDDFGSERVHSRFRPESGKSRRLPTQVMPPLRGVRDADTLRQMYCDRTAEATGSGTPAVGAGLTRRCQERWSLTYELVGADPGIASDLRRVESDLSRRLADQEFGELWSPMRSLWDRGLRERANVEFTTEDGELLIVPVVTPFLRGLPLLDGWLTLEGAFSADDVDVRRVSATYTPSASRPLDWYVKANFRDLGDSVWEWHGILPDITLDSRLEFGLKIRFQYDQVLGRIPLIGEIPILRRSFLGLRLGLELQESDERRGRGVRFRWAVGGGAW